MAIQATRAEQLAIAKKQIAQLEAQKVKLQALVNATAKLSTPIGDRAMDAKLAAVGAIGDRAIDAKLLSRAADDKVVAAREKAIAATKAAADNPGNSPDARRDRATAAKATQTLKEVTVAAKEVRINADPDVIAAKANQSAASGEVEATTKSYEEALANLENISPSVEVTPELLAATSGLDTNAGLTAGAVGAAKATGSPSPIDLPKQPGTAWIWNGDKWVKPDMPSDGQSYAWSDNAGWTVATTASILKGDVVIPARPGEAYVWNPLTKTWDRPPKPSGTGISWDDNDGWIVTTVIPGSSGTNTLTPERTLASDTFKNTMALVFGAKEASQPYVAKLYELVSGFYKTGSTQDEALNLAIREAYNNNAIPEFTKRFAGIFALDAKLRAGEAIQVPTIAEFFATEAKMGEVLQRAGLGDLANQEFLGNVIGLAKSVSEVSDLISTAFSSIDNAPDALKKTLQQYYPSASRSDLARAMLMGPEGAAALDKKIKGISVLSAFESQGLGTSLEQASDIAAMGYNYNQSLVGAGEVSKLKRAGELAQIGGTKFTQNQAVGAVFSKNAKDLAEIERLKQLEDSRFGGRSGIASSKSFASETRGMLQ